VTGSLIAVALFFWTLFGGPVPYWLAGLIATATVILAFFFAGRNEHLERLRLAKLLKPKLRISSGSVPGEDRWRVRVHNLSGRTVRFSAKLVSITPGARRLPIPSYLQITGTPDPHRVGEVSANGDALVDVCMNIGQTIDFLSAESPATIVEVAKTEYEIRICAYPISPDDGGACLRSFFIKPERDGSLMLFDAGKADPPDPR
jgi:hypothetical protein